MSDGATPVGAVTASAAVSEGNVLARFDRRVLSHMTTIANEHLSAAAASSQRQSLTAAAASEFITDDMVAEFVSDSELFWGYLMEQLDGYGEYMKLSAFRAEIMASIQGSAKAYRGIMTSLLAKGSKPISVREPVFGEFTSAHGVKLGDMRGVLSALGGGSPDAEVQLMGGPASGRTFSEWMSANAINVDERIWLYGDQSRRVFNGHLQVDGLVFTDWNDEALEIAPQDAWLKRNRYAPGDHFGCGCIVAPYVPNMGADIELNV